ncbi:MAG: hypothetical protein ABEL51_16420, partial [Salinibacter sp.]
IGGLATVLSGCFLVEEAARETIDAASEEAGEEAGEAVGRQVASAANVPASGTARWNRVMVSQAQVLFSYAFAANGMWPAEAALEEGEWVRYKLRAAGDGEAGFQTLERAFLRTTADGNEWWRVKAQQKSDTWVYEALIDPDQGRVVRLRSKDPKGNVGEVPVTKHTVYQPPQRLTQESIEGATVGKEQISTPAGTFTARKVKYMGGMGGGSVTWYLSEKVPGHVVRYRAQGGQGNAWISTLADYGSDATTILDSY